VACTCSDSTMLARFDDDEDNKAKMNAKAVNIATNNQIQAK